MPSVTRGAIAAPRLEHLACLAVKPIVPILLSGAANRCCGHPPVFPRAEAGKLDLSLCRRRLWRVSLLASWISQMQMLDAIEHWFSNGLHDGWLWVASLSMEQWFLLLGTAAAAGFLCMRGYGSRSNY
jgi:hypothetical protein